MNGPDIYRPEFPAGPGHDYLVSVFDQAYEKVLADVLAGHYDANDDEPPSRWRDGLDAATVAIAEQILDGMIANASEQLRQWAATARAEAGMESERAA